MSFDITIQGIRNNLRRNYENNIENIENIDNNNNNNNNKDYNNNNNNNNIESPDMPDIVSPLSDIFKKETPLSMSNHGSYDDFIVNDDLNINNNINTNQNYKMRHFSRATESEYNQSHTQIIQPHIQTIEHNSKNDSTNRSNSQLVVTLPSGRKGVLTRPSLNNLPSYEERERQIHEFLTKHKQNVEIKQKEHLNSNKKINFKTIAFTVYGYTDFYLCVCFFLHFVCVCVCVCVRWCRICECEKKESETKNV